VTTNSTATFQVVFIRVLRAIRGQSLLFSNLGNANLFTGKREIIIGQYLSAALLACVPIIFSPKQ
ncbi:MAG: hypothetical protein ACK5PB_05140, partial [Pirellula sp.]